MDTATSSDANTRNVSATENVECGKQVKFEIR